MYVYFHAFYAGSLMSIQVMLRRTASKTLCLRFFPASLRSSRQSVIPFFFFFLWLRASPLSFVFVSSLRLFVVWSVVLVVCR